MDSETASVEVKSEPVEHETKPVVEHNAKV